MNTKSNEKVEIIVDKDFTISITMDHQFKGKYSSVGITHITGGYYGCDGDTDMEDADIIKLRDALSDYIKHKSL